jgi:hypothetical protein
MQPAGCKRLVVILGNNIYKKNSAMDVNKKQATFFSD